MTAKKPTKTLTELAAEASGDMVQNASNLGALAKRFAEVTTELRAAAPEVDVNKHYVTILWVDKLASLAGIQAGGHASVWAAFDWAKWQIDGNRLAVHPGALRQMRSHGGLWAAYENRALDSANAGHVQFLKYGPGATYQDAPDQYPADNEHGAGWRYRLIGYVELSTGMIREKKDE